MVRKPVSRSSRLMLAAAFCTLPALAQAEVRCNVPLGQWQPKEALEAKLKNEGWDGARIRIDDGCYKVRAAGKDGARLRAKFNPETLQPVTGDDD